MKRRKRRKRNGRIEVKKRGRVTESGDKGRKILDEDTKGPGERRLEGSRCRHRFPAS